MMYQIKSANRQKLHNKKVLKAAMALLGLLILVLIFAPSSPASSLASDALYPFLKLGNGFYGSLGGFTDFFADKSRLAAENEALAQEVQTMKVNMFDYDSVKYENERLRQELKLKPLSEVVSSLVLARSPQVPMDTLVVDRGREDGVNVGDLVLAGDRVLVGKIAECSKHRATVSLDSFAGAVVYGFVERTEEPIELLGQGGGSIKATVPIDFDIAVGDRVMAHGSGSYLAGLVGAVEEDSPSGFKDVLLTLPVNASKANIVFIEPSLSQ